MSAIGTLVSSGLVEMEYPLGPLTTYKLGGPARFFAEVDEFETLGVIAGSGVADEMPVLVLGRGSNLVVADSGFAGLVVRLGAGFATVAFDEEAATVTAGSAVPLPKLARSVVDRGLTGLEFFVGVPGSVGGAVRQNAGCFGNETRERLMFAEVVSLRSGENLRASAADLELSYRHSNLAPTDVVTRAGFRLDVGDTDSARAEMRRITRWRRDNQPGGTLNAGSVFKNPEHVSAGELIDSLGLKGMSSGDVRVSEKHANFFVAGPAATSADIAQLISLVKDRVFEETGTILEPEVQLVGFDDGD